MHNHLKVVAKAQLWWNPPARHTCSTHEEIAPMRSIISICEASVSMRYISSAPVRNIQYLWVNWFEWKMSEIHSHRQCQILMDNNDILYWFDDVQPHNLWKILENLECNQHWPCLHHTLISFWTFGYQLLWVYTGWCIPWKTLLLIFCHIW